MKLQHHILDRVRHVYFFGYGADKEVDMIKAITGRKPHVVGDAILGDYELCIQALKDIPQKSMHIREMIGRGWGPDFLTYTIRPKTGSKVHGTLFRLSLHDRHAVDRWELTYAHWYEKTFINVVLESTGKVYQTETQIMGKGQTVSKVVSGFNYPAWLNPKAHFMRIAALDRKDRKS